MEINSIKVSDLTQAVRKSGNSEASQEKIIQFYEQSNTNGDPVLTRDEFVSGYNKNKEEKANMVTPSLAGEIWQSLVKKGIGESVPTSPTPVSQSELQKLNDTGKEKLTKFLEKNPQYIDVGRNFYNEQGDIMSVLHDGEKYKVFYAGSNDKKMREAPGKPDISRGNAGGFVGRSEDGKQISFSVHQDHVPDHLNGQEIYQIK
jgi:hypothetical protein